MKYFNFALFAVTLISITAIPTVFAYDVPAAENHDLTIEPSVSPSASSALQARILIGGQNSQSAASSLRIPSALIVPALIIKTISSLPGAMAAAIGEHSVHHLGVDDMLPENVTSIDIRGILTHTTLEKRKYCCFFNSCYWCSGPGSGPPGSGAGSVRPPRVFALPNLILSAVGSLSEAAAAIIPSLHRRYDSLEHSRDLATAFSSSPILKSAEKAVGDVVGLMLHHEEQRDLVNAKNSLKLHEKYVVGKVSAVGGWEDRLKGAWVSTMGAAVAFARNL